MTRAQVVRVSTVTFRRRAHGVSFSTLTRASHFLQQFLILPQCNQAPSHPQVLTTTDQENPQALLFLTCSDLVIQPSQDVLTATHHKMVIH
ncbi:hypothetical protein DPEC_G00086260 [Dallia pectoralis]|uniref:Uncharacterized protein n=1 Tax=Dallia pectoralis TaxID=75939 RepID=A0ACC2GZP8_DALPE|nr:hypothetical protein DPEC_G00086260 [Dallia pectoralis]